MAAIRVKRNGSVNGRAPRVRSSNGAAVANASGDRSPTGLASARENADGVSSRRPAALTVRPAGPIDFEPLSFFFDTALRRDYFIRRGQLKEIVEGSHHRVFIAEIDGVLVGVAITTRGSRLVNALVHPGYRGLGIGRALIESSGASEVRVKLDMSSGDPTAFYRTLGFEHTGEMNAKGNIELMRRPA